MCGETHNSPNVQKSILLLFLRLVNSLTLFLTFLSTSSSQYIKAAALECFFDELHSIVFTELWHLEQTSNDSETHANFILHGTKEYFSKSGEHRK